MRVVDCQAHLHHRTYFEAHVGRAELPWAERANGGYLFRTTTGNATAIPPAHCEIDRQMAELEEQGVDVVVSSMGAFNVDHLPPSQATELAMQLNEECAELERRFSSRYYGLAVLPMQDAHAAIETLDYAVRTLRLRGVCICSNVNGESIAAPIRRPIYRRIDELGVPVFLHPTATASERRPGRYGHERAVTSIVDLSVAALDLIFSGILDRHPTLRVVHPCLGGVLPYVASQLRHDGSSRRSEAEPPQRAPSEYGRRFYADSVSVTPPLLRLAADVYGHGRLLYASDYPHHRPAASLDVIRSELGGDALSQVLSRNAVSLLGLEA